MRDVIRQQYTTASRARNNESNMATPRARRMSERDRLILQSTPLAEAETTENIELAGQNLKLRIVVGVHRCPRGFRSRLGYHATLYLTKADGVESYVGYITAWRISKPTGKNPNTDPRYYMDDWYHKRTSAYDRDSKLLAACIRAIIEPSGIDGDNYDQVLDEGKRNQLRDDGNELVYIQTIYIKWREDPYDDDTEYSGRGLAPIYLICYYRLLGGKTLPAWFNISGSVTYLMIPRLHGEDALNEMWHHKFGGDDSTEESQSIDQTLDQRVTAALIKAFSGEAYGYEMYVDTARVFDVYISVMGHVVTDDMSLADIEADRFILPAVT